MKVLIFSLFLFFLSCDNYIHTCTYYECYYPENTVWGVLATKNSDTFYIDHSEIINRTYVFIDYTDTVIKLKNKGFKIDSIIIDSMALGSAKIIIDFKNHNVDQSLKNFKAKYPNAYIIEETRTCDCYGGTRDCHCC